MRKFQDTFKTRKRSFMKVFFDLHDCTFKVIVTNLCTQQKMLIFKLHNIKKCKYYMLA